MNLRHNPQKKKHIPESEISFIKRIDLDACRKIEKVLDKRWHEGNVEYQVKLSGSDKEGWKNEGYLKQISKDARHKILLFNKKLTREGKNFDNGDLTEDSKDDDLIGIKRPHRVVDDEDDNEDKSPVKEEKFNKKNKRGLKD